jgi:hypothetical protein
VLDQDGNTLQVTEKGEAHKEILHKTADQLADIGGQAAVREPESESKYRFAVYLAEETEDGLKPIRPVEKDFTAEEIINLLSQEPE